MLDFVDLHEVPFSVPESRFVVVAQQSGLTAYWVRYEVDLADCVVVQGVTVTDSHGDHMAVSRALGAALEFADGSQLAIAGEGIAMILAPGSTLNYELGPGQQPARMTVQETDFGLWIGQEPVPHSVDQWWRHAHTIVDEWMSRTPRAARASRQPMVDQCWWVLGINTLRLSAHGGIRVVVPSKRGYVGHWQWDAYFIAAGLRHGDLDLAHEQMDIALRFQQPDGLLPDVVHEQGVLASSDDLPASDRKNLEETGYDTSIPIPLTKPPLTAWAVEKLLDSQSESEQLEVLNRWYPQIIKAHTWWFTQPGQATTGIPTYAHPYSSGLDDSPVFDHGTPVESPDLIAYLGLQEEVLAQWEQRFPQLVASSDAQAFVAARASRQAILRSALTTLWSKEKEYFAARRQGELLEEDTIVSQLAALSPQLTEHEAAALADRAANPALYNAQWGMPTVAVSDPTYQPTRMWRGPIWINTAYLVALGLDNHGYAEQAAGLRRTILDLVEHAGGPHEFYIPETGFASPSAVRCFGWSAALYIDLAVSERFE